VVLEDSWPLPAAVDGSRGGTAAGGVSGWDSSSAWGGGLGLGDAHFEVL
jgi:hypothetical protein